VAELGGAVAHNKGEVRDGATARGPVGRQAGGGVPLPQRGLVALDRARADAEAVAGAQVRDEGGVFADGEFGTGSAIQRNELELLSRLFMASPGVGDMVHA
jgi:hypothetical protein